MTTTTAATAAIAAALPNYDIGRELGRGGFGVVYAGVQRHLGRQVAIKQLPTVFANDTEVRERFATEARVVAGLGHPHIVPVYDYVEQDGLCLLVMESLTGGSVWDVFRSDGINPAHACVLVIAAAAGLHHAHVNGVLHRDVKPENLLLTADNHLKVTDFGIAKVIGGLDAVATNDGAILGTPAYMAPEQADGSPLGPPADVYAAGVMLYELLAGTLPFSQEGGGLAIVYRHLTEAPRPLTDVAPSVPRPLAEVVMRALAREAKDRYANAEEFACAIGDAGQRSFGDDWYRDSGLRVIGSDNVMSTLTSGSLRPARPGPQPPAGPTSAPALDDDEDRATNAMPWLAPELVPPGPSTQLAPAQPTQPAANLPDVRPTEARHVVGVLADDATPETLIPVRRLLDVPPPPYASATAALVAGLLLALAAFVGVGTAVDHDGTAPGAITLSGTDVTTADKVRLNLGDDIPLTASAPPPAARSAVLDLAVRGIPVGSSDEAPLTRTSTGAAATLKVGSLRYLIGGPLEGTVHLRDAAGADVATQQVRIDRARNGFLTVSGAVVVLLTLFALGYVESLIRPMRRVGAFRPVSGAGLAAVGVVLGVALGLLAWTAGRYVPSVGSLAACAVPGAAFAVLLGVTLSRTGLRRRIRRINKRTG